MQRFKKIIKIVLITVVIIFVTLLVLYGLFIYTLKYKVSIVGKCQSPDGKYVLELKSVGEPIFFSSADGRLVLKKGKKKVVEYDFTLYDDGGSVGTRIWKVAWKKNHVVVIISGDEQSDELIRLGFDGKKDSRQLATIHGKMPGQQEQTEAETEDRAEAEAEVETEAEREAEVEAEREVEAKIDAGYKAIYHVLFEENNDSFIRSYDAKGHSQVILHEDDTVVEYLVYDRDSQNGKCGLYVYYKSVKNADGSWSSVEGIMEDTFAYVYDSGEVISSGKKTWSDAGSARYQRAAGEA